MLNGPAGAEEILPVPPEIPVHTGKYFQTPNHLGAGFPISTLEVLKGGEIAPFIEEGLKFSRQGRMLFQGLELHHGAVKLPSQFVDPLSRLSHPSSSRTRLRLAIDFCLFSPREAWVRGFALRAKDGIPCHRFVQEHPPPKRRLLPPRFGLPPTNAPSSGRGRLLFLPIPVLFLPNYKQFS